MPQPPLLRGRRPAQWMGPQCRWAPACPFRL